MYIILFKSEFNVSVLLSYSLGGYACRPEFSRKGHDENYLAYPFSSCPLLSM